MLSLQEESDALKLNIISSKEYVEAEAYIRAQQLYQKDLLSHVIDYAEALSDLEQEIIAEAKAKNVYSTDQFEIKHKKTTKVNPAFVQAVVEPEDFIRLAKISNTDFKAYIAENEHKEKTKYLTMWKMVTGVAASIIIVLGGFLFYQQKQKPFDDTFDNSEQAYAYAEHTLQFVSGKYNKGLAEFSNFEKLNTANKPINKGVARVNEFYEGIEKIKSN